MKVLALSLVSLMALSLCQAALRLREADKPKTRSVVSAAFYYQKNRLESRAFNVSGAIAAEGSAPWQVSVQNNSGFHICGGAIIGDNVILTSATCVAALDGRGDIRVVTGTNNWKKPAATYEVDDIIIHCNYDKPLYHNDVALIKLTSSIAYDDRTHDVTLANSDALTEGDILTMTGWGSPEHGKPHSKRLRKTNVGYISNKDCAAIENYGPDVDHGHLCVLPKRSKGACSSDTGGPLVNSEGELVGIGNWGVPCGFGYPDVFARVSFYNDWIRTSLKGCSM